jgi:hypothetical protein
MSKRKREGIDLKTKYEILQDIDIEIDYSLIVSKYTGSFKTFWEGVSEKTTKDIKSN